MEAKNSNRNFLTSLMHGDNWMWGVYWLLFIISFVEIASASSRLTSRTLSNDSPLAQQVKHLVLGFFCLVYTLQNLSAKNLKVVQILCAFLYVGGVALMCAMPIFGRAINGAHRDIGGVQTVEFCKIGLIMMLCTLITTKDTWWRQHFAFFRDHTEGRRFCLYLVLIGLAVIPIALQNLSSALILGSTSVAVLILGNAKKSHLIKLFVGLGIAGALFMSGLVAMHMYHKNFGRDLPIGRATTWEHRIFDRSNDIPLWEQERNDENMQVMNAHCAIANSRGIGTFIGESKMRDFLPEAYSDYIYAIIFEETGIIGAGVVMMLYFVLLLRCYKMSCKTNSETKRLILISLPLMIVIQALIHMGVSCDALFVTGQPLPLISRGGMSIMATSAIFGILFGLSYSVQNEKENN